MGSPSRNLWKSVRWCPSKNFFTPCNSIWWLKDQFWEVVNKTFKFIHLSNCCIHYTGNLLLSQRHLYFLSCFRWMVKRLITVNIQLTYQINLVISQVRNIKTTFYVFYMKTKKLKVHKTQFENYHKCLDHTLEPTNL